MKRMSTDTETAAPPEHPLLTAVKADLEQLVALAIGTEAGARLLNRALLSMPTRGLTEHEVRDANSVAYHSGRVVADVTNMAARLGGLLQRLKDGDAAGSAEEPSLH